MVTGLLQVVSTGLIQAVCNKLLHASCHQQLVNNLLHVHNIRLAGTNLLILLGDVDHVSVCYTILSLSCANSQLLYLGYQPWRNHFTQYEYRSNQWRMVL